VGLAPPGTVRSTRLLGNPESAQGATGRFRRRTESFCRGFVDELWTPAEIFRGCNL